MTSARDSQENIPDQAVLCFHRSWNEWQEAATCCLGLSETDGVCIDLATEKENQPFILRAFRYSLVGRFQRNILVRNI